MEGEPDYELQQRIEGFDVIDCVRRQVDACNLTLERVQQEIDIHVKYGRITAEEAQERLYRALGLAPGNVVE